MVFKEFNKYPYYTHLGEEEILPSCGNDCIYRENGNGDNDQLYCFPTSFSKLENQCDFTSTVPHICK